MRMDAIKHSHTQSYTIISGKNQNGIKEEQPLHYRDIEGIIDSSQKRHKPAKQANIKTRHHHQQNNNSNTSRGGQDINKPANIT